MRKIPSEDLSCHRCVIERHLSVRLSDGRSTCRLVIRAQKRSWNLLDLWFPEATRKLGLRFSKGDLSSIWICLDLHTETLTAVGPGPKNLRILFYKCSG